MSSPLSAITTTLLRGVHPHPEVCPFPAVRFVCPTFWAPQDAPPGRLIRCDAILATETYYSVIPHQIAEDVRMRVLDAGLTVQPLWYGVPCKIGTVMFAVKTVELPGQRAFSLRVLIPEEETPEAAPVILLGTSFLVENRVQVRLDGTPPGAGMLLIPRALGSG